MSSVEIVLKKMRMIGQRAISKYGKNYKSTREPIMILIMANEHQIENIENTLVEEQYFDYKGVICLSQSIVPILNSRGKIQMKNEEEILLSSDGSGGFLGNLSKARIFESWDRANIQYLQVINLKNLSK